LIPRCRSRDLQEHFPPASLKKKASGMKNNCNYYYKRLFQHSYKKNIRPAFPLTHVNDVLKNAIDLILKRNPLAGSSYNNPLNKSEPTHCYRFHPRTM
jgi:hypothetical protein